MDNAEALQRQQKELAYLKLEIERDLDSLDVAYRMHIDDITGKRASPVSSMPGVHPFLFGIEWAAKDSATLLSLNAERLAKLMEGIKHDINEPVTLDSLSSVPQEDWDEYMRLWEDYRAARAIADKKLAGVHKYAQEKIDPHR